MTNALARTPEQKRTLAELQRKAVELLLPAELEVPWDDDLFPDPRMAHICKLVFIGVNYSTAKSFARVDSDTYGEWLRRSGSSRSQRPDSEPDPEYVYFADCLDLADACAKARAIWVLTSAVLSGNLDAAKFWLEKRHKTAFGPGMDESVVAGGVQLVKLVLPDNRRLEETVHYDGEVTEEQLKE